MGRGTAETLWGERWEGGGRKGGIINHHQGQSGDKGIYAVMPLTWGEQFLSGYVSQCIKVLNTCVLEGIRNDETLMVESNTCGVNNSVYYQTVGECT